MKQKKELVKREGWGDGERRGKRWGEVEEVEEVVEAIEHLILDQVHLQFDSTQAQ